MESLYKVLSFLGFPEGFIKWIKLFNNDIQAFVIHCSFLFQMLSINRGCRQGDPNAAYMFILCGQEIKGVTVNNIEYKLTQFADDTTLLINGSQQSVKAALNVLEIFGNMSGLKMNTEKTKVIWIGDKKYSNNKLQVNSRLECGITEFTLLGITFNVDINKIVEINFYKAIEQSKSVLNNWKNVISHLLGKYQLLKHL